MKKILIISLTILCGTLPVFFTGCYKNTSQGEPKEPELVAITILDRNGMSEIVSNPDRLEQFENVDFTQPQPYQKVIRVYSRDCQGNIPAIITSYHPNGTPRQYLEVVNSASLRNIPRVVPQWTTEGSSLHHRRHCRYRTRIRKNVDIRRLCKSVDRMRRSRSRDYLR